MRATIGSRPAPISILLVEDNEDDVYLIQEAFAQAKVEHNLLVARDGVEAMQCLRGQGAHKGTPLPGLMLLDINMPRKDGFGVLRDVKADPELRHLPVVILTTSDAAGDIARAYASGACSYITKPGDFTVFRELVRQFVNYWTSVSRIPDITAGPD